MSLNNMNKTPSLADLLKKQAAKPAMKAIAPKLTLDQFLGKTAVPVSPQVPKLPPVEGLRAPEPTPGETPKRKSRKRRAYELKDKCPKKLTGAQIKRWRMGIGITQDKARKLLGMSRTSYIEMEHNGVQSKRTVLALRAILRGLHKSPLYKHEGALDAEPVSTDSTETVPTTTED